MANELLIGLAAAASFFEGSLIYKYTKEELDPFISKIKPLYLSYAAIVLSAVFGVVLGFGITTNYSGYFAISIFTSGVAVGSLALGKDYRPLLSAITAFLAAYLVVSVV